MRCLYLSTTVRSSEPWVYAPKLRNHLIGRSEAFDTCWQVVDEVLPEVVPQLRGELRRVSSVEALAPDLVVVERRLFDGRGPRVPFGLLERLVHRGAQLLVLFVDDPQQLAPENAAFLGATAIATSAGGHHILARDRENGVRGNQHFVAAPRAEMQLVSEDFAEAYARADILGCRNAIVLQAHQHILATAGRTAAALTALDQWSPDVDLLTFATVQMWGAGHVAVFSGDLFSDEVLGAFPHNLDFVDDLLDIFFRRSAERSFDSLPSPDADTMVESREDIATGTGTTMGEADQRRKVFLVHGRDDDARRAVEELLVAFDLKLVTWARAAELAGGGSPYTGDIVSAGMNDAHGVVVLLTPDDEGRLKPDFLTDRDGADERQLTGQPRMNVLFEAGMAMGIDRDRVVLVEVGAVRQMSDIAGVNVVRLDGSIEHRMAFGRRLHSAGFAVDMSNERWFTAGSFSTTRSAPPAPVRHPSSGLTDRSPSIAGAYERFWALVLDLISKRSDLAWVRTRSTPGENGVLLGSDGRGGSYIVNFARQGRIVAQYYIGGSDADANLRRFRALEVRRGEIEVRFGGPLTWEDLPHRKACRIAAYADGSIRDGNEHRKYAEWMLDNVSRLRGAISAEGSG
jgi:predicted nucleotide-binding protein